jgi:type II secretory pathway component GspD/PulD (secretin)
MKERVLLVSILVIIAVCAITARTEAQSKESPSQTMVTELITPDYISPSELVKFLGTTETGATHVFFCDIQNRSRPVQVRFNEPANLLALTGAPADVAVVRDLVKSADIPPRQIIIETQIIEIDQKELDNLGIDWQELLNSSGANISYDYTKSKRDVDQRSSPPSYGTTEGHSTATQSASNSRLNASLRPDQFLHIIAEHRAGTLRSAPRIVTINNRPAKILDGDRVSYVTRYSSYTNLFETQTMDAGLSLSATPSIGKSGYIVLNITAELTSLSGNIAGSPSKSGQILENTVVVRDGETFLLGGLNRNVDYATKRRVPVLGTILPFLFSRTVTTKTTNQVFVLLTPRVIDLEPQTLDKKLDGFLKP